MAVESYTSTRPSPPTMGRQSLLRPTASAAQGRAAGEPTLLENVKLTSSHPSYTWVNGLQIWTQGTSPPVNLKGYTA